MPWQSLLIFRIKITCPGQPPRHELDYAIYGNANGQFANAGQWQSQWEWHHDMLSHSHSDWESHSHSHSRALPLALTLCLTAWPWSIFMLTFTVTHIHWYSHPSLITASVITHIHSHPLSASTNPITNVINLSVTLTLSSHNFGDMFWAGHRYTFRHVGTFLDHRLVVFVSGGRCGHGDGGCSSRFIIIQSQLGQFQSDL